MYYAVIKHNGHLRPHGSCIHHLGLDICLDECNYREILQVHLIYMDVDAML